MKEAGDRGFALVVAVAGAAVFALLCLEVLDAGRGATGLLQAQQDRAVLAAAAQAAVAQAIYGLGIEDRTRRLPVDGLPHVSDFDGVRVTTTAVYESSKIAINTAGPDIERRLFAAAGVSGERLDILVDSLEDWKDVDDTARPHGAESVYYAPHGIRPRGGALLTLGELGLVRGMDPGLLARIAPAITLLAGRRGGFVADSAPPLALEAMRDPAAASFDLQKRQQELAGERTALDIAADMPILGRPVSIHVDAALGPAVYTMEETVEFTGNAQQPFWIRNVQ